MHCAPQIDYESPSVAGYGAGARGFELMKQRAQIVRARTNRTYLPAHQSTSTKMPHAELRLTINAEEFARADGAWRTHVCNVAAPVNVDALEETVQAVIDFLRKYGPHLLDLSTLKAAEVQCEHLAALLRVTSRLKSKIPGWSSAFDSAEVAVTRAGQDIDDVLFGMSK